MLRHKNEKGQALILIVLAIVGLIGLTALAVDGGNAYADRRQAQNAVDAAALAAAHAKAGGGNDTQITAAAMNMIIANGYNTGANISINSPPTNYIDSNNDGDNECDEINDGDGYDGGDDEDAGGGDDDDDNDGEDDSNDDDDDNDGIDDEHDDDDDNDGIDDDHDNDDNDDDNDGEENDEDDDDDNDGIDDDHDSDDDNDGIDDDHDDDNEDDHDNDGIDDDHDNDDDNDGIPDDEDDDDDNDGHEEPSDEECEHSQYSNDPTYIQVIITSYVDTYFAPIVGITRTKNVVQAITRVIPATPGVMYAGHAVVGLAPSGCDAVYVAGNGQIQTWGGGLFSNSTDTCGMHFQGSSQTQTHEGSGGINMVASAYQITGGPSIQTHGEGTHGNLPQYPYPPTDLPNPVCSGTATKTGNTMSPGNYSATFPPSGVDTLQSGVYCLSGSFKMNAGSKLTGNEVLIVLETGGSLDWNGSSEIKLSAPQSGPFKGLLIFARLGNPDNHPKMYINGNSNSKLTGTVLMPSIRLYINGNNTQLQKTNSQIIAYKVEFSGSSDTQIEMNAASQFQPPTSPIIQLVQ